MPTLPNVRIFTQEPSKPQVGYLWTKCLVYNTDLHTQNGHGQQSHRSTNDNGMQVQHGCFLLLVGGQHVGLKRTPDMFPDVAGLASWSCRERTVVGLYHFDWELVEPNCA